MMALDLSALQEKITEADLRPVSGQPLQLRLSDIEEDPDQPRKEFSEEALREMTASVKERGVKTPISVRPHPHKPGQWMLNYGARRYRASLAAGKTTIPAFVDESHDDYDQVIENIQREDLKPMELALFIQKRLAAGDKKGAIAQKLGKDAALITQHLALIDAPACIEEVYVSGRCTSPKTLYELRSLHEQFPDQVQMWCTGHQEITRAAVTALSAVLKDMGTADVVQVDPAHPETTATGASDELDSAQHEAPAMTLDAASQTTPPSPSPSPVLTPPRLLRPLLVVVHSGRSAVVLLSRRPSRTGQLVLRYEDDGVEQEVPAGHCRISMLTEADADVMG